VVAWVSHVTQNLLSGFSCLTQQFEWVLLNANASLFSHPGDSGKGRDCAKDHEPEQDRKGLGVAAE
jgi:hypothetical protein